MYQIMETTNGKIAWLSVNTRRVFTEYEDALEDAIKFNYVMYDNNSIKRAQTEVNVVHLWLNK